MADPWIALGLLVLILFINALPPVTTFWFDFEFTADGIRVVVFGGALRRLWLPRQKIASVRIFSVKSLSGLEAWQFVSKSIGLGNRYGDRVVVVEKANGKRSYCLTPRDPDAAVAALGM